MKQFPTFLHLTLSLFVSLRHRKSLFLWQYTNHFRRDHTVFVWNSLSREDDPVIITKSSYDIKSIFCLNIKLFKRFNTLVPTATMQSSVLPAELPFGVLGTVRPRIIDLLILPSMTNKKKTVLRKENKRKKSIINCINFTIFLLRFLVLWNFN